MEEIRKLLLKAGRAKGAISSGLQDDKAYKSIEVKNVEKEGLTFLKVRDALFGLGQILEENSGERYYLTTIRVGSSGARAALVIVRVDRNKAEIASYAKEGLINQHTAQQAIDRLLVRLGVSA